MNRSTTPPHAGEEAASRREDYPLVAVPIPSSSRGRAASELAQVPCGGGGLRSSGERWRCCCPTGATPAAAPVVLIRGGGEGVLAAAMSPSPE
eukprot:CAMPEP_0206383450 /NCGR_PEP_ID=MMETSP0294-20121207/13932_1 /ASSEMBLY_ACC=CAM_ASM_000327 /TAXON_ID=39354 /ORGANISM="Heterosigma akashiwo, Strain CCMP2393" /LENGTH=92 /DNA_ID=CAMNT_0053833463 /DNA_START=1591 /DNA_END=1870 /DNA_ORIENTATION=+